MSTESQVEEVYLGLGSNVEPREAHLREALEGLARHPAIDVAEASPVYETAAHTLVPDEQQPDYLNAVVQVVTSLIPEALLAYAQQLEEDAGRELSQRRRWAPRTLDVDILLFGQRTIREGHLTVPHPRMGERLFVLQPLYDLAPALHVPDPFGAAVSELLERCPDEGKIDRTDADLISSVR